MAETYNKDELTRRMKGAVTTLRGEFSGLRTGRASPALLDPVRSSLWQHVPINQVRTFFPGTALLTFRSGTGPASGRQSHPRRQSGLNPKWTASCCAFPTRLNEEAQGLPSWPRNSRAHFAFIMKAAWIPMKKGYRISPGQYHKHGDR